MRTYFTVFFIVFYSFSLLGQIVSIDPAFPTRDEVITITYDATQGNAGLVGVNQVYMHTGLITANSSSGSDWKYVVGNWGTDDPKVKMTNIGNDKHQLSYTINEFYGIPTDEEILKLAFVFRNVDGSKEGKTEQVSDIFLDFEESADFAGQLITPTQTSLIVNVGDVLPIKYATSQVADITIKENSTVLYTETTDIVEYDYQITQVGSKVITISAEYMGETISKSFSVTANPPVTIAELPEGSKPGINHISDTSSRLVLLAPGKNNVYVIGDFNEWAVDTSYYMKRTADGDYFWIDIENLDADQNYAFQYFIDGKIKVADPFSELVLDPNNDGGISSETFPDIHPYPSTGANGYVSLLRTGAENYDWQYDYEPVPNEKLVIYELLMRDFTGKKNYQTLMDTLEYLDRLGINAIELMPVNEFEGNQSWGYNPSFHMALDKYYGTPEAFKAFVDECHRRDIAVILDVVYNHAFSQSPLAKMYWEASNFRPSEDSPFLNQEAKHLYNVGYDFNHESPYTRLFVDRVVQYWLEEYNIDGYRFDLSKGFTQKETTTDGAFSAYDASRVEILKHYADKTWEANPDAYIILEHFAANNEEKALSDYGMMLWSNSNHNFSEASMGYNAGDNSNFEWIDYKVKGWNQPNAVGFMESHDEERVMYRNINFGNSGSTYDIKEMETALQRVELCNAFLYMIPGPKMLWQFGEVGYDFSINRCENGTINPNCRLSPKPIRWDYQEDLNRKRVYDVLSAIIHLKTDYDITESTDYSHDLSGAKKFLKLESDDKNAVVVGNFEIGSRSIAPVFPHSGTWYDYITGDSIEVNNVLMNIILQAGEYKIFIDEKIGDPVIISGVEDVHYTIIDYTLMPNPSQESITIDMNLETSQNVQLSILKVDGTLVKFAKSQFQAGANQYRFEIEEFPNGTYFLMVKGDNFQLTDRFIKM